MSDAELMRCQACGAVNRVPAEKIRQGLEPICGRCGRPLSKQASAEPIIVTDATFAERVERSPKPVLVDMWAAWCGPCWMIAPIVEQLATEMAGRATIAKLNVDENPATAARFRVQSIPTLLVFKAGREVDRIVGAHPKQEIVRRLEQAIAAG